MKIRVVYGEDVFVLPKKIIAKHLTQANDLDIRILLALCADNRLREEYDTRGTELAEILDCTKEEIDLSVAYWRGAGILATDARAAGKEKKERLVATEEPKEKRIGKLMVNNILPQYTGEEVAAITQEHGEVMTLINVCQQTVGKMFNPMEVNKVVTLYDYMRLDVEYIITLCAYCSKIGKKSIAYIEKTALSFYDKGITTPESLEAYLKALEKYGEVERQIRALYGIGERALTEKERNSCQCWVCDWEMPFSMIEYAYERTIESIQKPSISYAHKILSSWHELGFTTVEQAKDLVQKYKEENSPQTESSFDGDEFFQLALKRSYEKQEDD